MDRAIEIASGLGVAGLYVGGIVGLVVLMIFAAALRP